MHLERAVREPPLQQTRRWNREIRLISGTEVHKYFRIASLGFLLLFFSFLTMAAALAQESKAYISQKYGFAFQYPAVYELKVAVDSYFDFKKGGGTLFCLRVDDRFIEMLYQMLHPGLVVFRAGEDPYRDLAKETRKNRELFYRYARNEAKNWCVADGPDGSVYCQAFKSEKSFTSRSGLAWLELYPIMTREEFESNTKERGVVGPVFGVYVPKGDLPLVLMISPLHGQSASPDLVREMREIIDSLKVRP